MSFEHDLKEMSKEKLQEAKEYFKKEMITLAEQYKLLDSVNIPERMDTDKSAKRMREGLSPAVIIVFQELCVCGSLYSDIDKEILSRKEED